MSNIVFGEGACSPLRDSLLSDTVFLYLPLPCQDGTGDSGVPQELPSDQASRETGSADLTLATW
ncbi:hypothetical protein AWB69_01285 [Caballeronia udeis]|uniref:Uncharacterized protein n=1 Tax=Caballeronia udeis TaxID=1232866 RepID=A0A158FK34_9BURK|nr:hypothetical protein AWB69_01285 [Caballeronia udeis]